MKPAVYWHYHLQGQLLSQATVHHCFTAASSLRVIGNSTV